MVNLKWVASTNPLVSRGSWYGSDVPHSITGLSQRGGKHIPLSKEMHRWRKALKASGRSHPRCGWSAHACVYPAKMMCQILQRKYFILVLWEPEMKACPLTAQMFSFSMWAQNTPSSLCTSASCGALFKPRKVNGTERPLRDNGPLLLCKHGGETLVLILLEKQEAFILHLLFVLQFHTCCLLCQLTGWPLN